MKRLTATLLFITSLAALLAAQSLIARVEGDQLRITAPRLHFLLGESLSRLRDGATVRYAFQLTARVERTGRLLARREEQFAVSYDLWEEKFAVARLGASPKSVSRLSAAAAEAWCIDNTTLPIAGLSASQPFWVRLDYRTDDSTPPVDPADNSGFTLSALIDIFSRRTRSEQVHGVEEIGPLRLDNLKKR